MYLEAVPIPSKDQEQSSGFREKEKKKKTLVWIAKSQPHQGTKVKEADNEEH